MSDHIATGINGESLAVAFLKEKQFVIKELNWRWKRCEVDIIAFDKDTLVFIEVKTRKSKAFGLPEESVNEAKQKQLSLAAQEYIEQTQHQGESRFDIVSIILKRNQAPEIFHVADAFFPFH